MVGETHQVVFEAKDRSQQLRSFDARVERSARKSIRATERIRAGWAKIRTGVMVAGAAVAGFVALGIKKAAEQEQAVNRLNAALKSQGRYSAAASKELQDYAAALQKVTIYGDEAIMPVMALIQTLGGGSIDEIKRATRATLDFAAATGTDLKAAAILMGKAMAGETSSLSRYGLIISEQEKKTKGFQAVLDAIATKMGGQAQEATKTFTGKMQQLNNAIGDMLERAFMPMLQKFTEWLNTGDNQEKLLKTFENAIGALSVVVEQVGSLVSTASNVFNALKESYESLPEPIRKVLEGGILKPHTSGSPGQNLVANVGLYLAPLLGMTSAGVRGAEILSGEKYGGGWYTQVAKQQLSWWKEIFKEQDKVEKKTKDIAKATTEWRLATDPLPKLTEQEAENIERSARAAEEYLRFRRQITDEIMRLPSLDMDRVRGMVITSLSAAESQMLSDAILAGTKKATEGVEDTWYRSLDSVAEMFSRTFGGEGSVIGQALSAFLALVERYSGDMAQVWENHWNDVLAIGLSALGQLFGGGRGSRAFSGAAMGLQTGYAIGGPWGAAIGGIGGFFAGLFSGGGRQKINPADYAADWKEILQGYFDAIDQYIDTGTSIPEKLLADITQSLTYSGSRWVDKIDEISAALDAQKEALYNAHNQMRDYRFQLVQGAMALFSYRKQLWELNNQIKDTKKSLLEMATAGTLTFRMPNAPWAPEMPGPGGALSGQAALDAIYQALEGAQNARGIIPWGRLMQIAKGANAEAFDLILRLGEQLNQKALLNYQIDQQRRANKVLKHQRDLLKNNLPLMRARLDRIREILAWIKEHWRETPPDGGGGGGGGGHKPDDGRKQATGGDSSTTNYYTSPTTITIPVTVKLDGKTLQRELHVIDARNPGAKRRRLRG